MHFTVYLLKIISPLLLIPPKGGLPPARATDFPPEMHAVGGMLYHRDQQTRPVACCVNKVLVGHCHASFSTYGPLSCCNSRGDLYAGSDGLRSGYQEACQPPASEEKVLGVGPH